TKSEQPRDLGHVQLAIVEVTNCQIAPQLLKYLREVQPFVRKPSCKRPLAHSHTAGNVFHARSARFTSSRSRETMCGRAVFSEGDAAHPITTSQPPGRAD